MYVIFVFSISFIIYIYVEIPIMFGERKILNEFKVSLFLFIFPLKNFIVSVIVYN